MNLLPTVDFVGHRFSRLVLGSNPFSGFSHQRAEVDMDMVRYYTAPRIHEAWDEAERQGINIFCARADQHMLRVLAEYTSDATRRSYMHWLAQTVPELESFEKGIREMMGMHDRWGIKPTAIYHQGGQLDALWHENKQQLIKDRLKLIRDQGVLVGLATHQPEILLRIEEEGWDVDFYVASFYNLTGRGKKGLTVDVGPAGEVYDAEDPPRMCQAIQQVSRPCIAIKILGAGRRCRTAQEVRQAFKFAFDHIKPTDLVAVGVFQKYSNQIRQNVQIVSELLSGGEPHRSEN